MKLNFGIIGCGMVADYHITGLLRTEKVEITWLCDLAAQLLKNKALSIPARLTDNYQQILADQTTDAIVICTPPHTHYKIASDCMNAGKHVLIEKPAAINLNEIENLYRKSLQHPELIVMESSARHTRLQPKFKYIKNFIAAGNLGTIYAIHHNAVFSNQRPGVEYHAQATWFLNKQLAGGGPLIDWGVYDLAFHLGILDDKPQLDQLISFHINGLDQCTLVSSNVEEHGFVTMKFSDLIYYWERSSHAYNETANETRIYGKKGGLKFNYLTWGSNEIIFYKSDVRGNIHQEVLSVDMGHHLSHLEDFYALDEHFVHCIMHRLKPILSLELASKHLTIIFNALNSG